MRIACLLVPDLPLRAELRVHPELAGQPLAVTSGPDARAQVIAVSPEAAARGVRTSDSLTHARSVCPELQVRATSLAAERAAREALLDVALSCSPRAAPAPRSAGVFAAEAAVFLDATGITSLFRSERGFATALQGLAHLAARATHPEQSESASPPASPPKAGAQRGEAERSETGIRILPPGSETRFLAPLPIDLLDPDDRLAQTLTRFGVRTVRDLLSLPRRGLAHRLGPEALRLLARARGEEVEAPLPEKADTRLEEAVDLEVAVDRLETLLFALRGALSRLAERLALRGLAPGPLDLRLGLEGGGRDSRRVGVAAPTRDTRVLLRLVSLALETHPPEAPIESLSVATRGLPLRRDQLDLFRPRGPSSADLDQTLAELESLCGAGRVGAPEVADDHRPNVFQIKPFHPVVGDRPATRALRSGAAVPDPPGDALAVRALRPPVTAQVRVDRGRPEWIRSAVASGQVLHAAGPWRTTGRWWSEGERFAVDHYDVQVSDGTILRLGFDFIHRIWQIDAIYD
jgi:protein ImuB